MANDEPVLANARRGQGAPIPRSQFDIRNSNHGLADLTKAINASFSFATTLLSPISL